MKKTHFITLCLGLTTLVILGVIVLTKNSGAGTDSVKIVPQTNEDPSSDLERKPSGTSSEVPDGSWRVLHSKREDYVEFDSSLEFVYDYFEAKSADKAQVAIDEIRNSGDNVLADGLEFELNGRCGFLTEYEPPFERTRWAFELIEEYCKSYVPRIDTSGDNLLRGSTIKIASYSKLMAKFMKMESADFEVYFSEFLLNVKSMQELKAAQSMADYLHQSGAPISFGQENDRLYSPAESTLILNTAFTLFGCLRFGGCEQNDIRVLEYCVLSGNCERGWNMFDIYSYTLAPNIYERVKSTLDNMVSSNKKNSSN